MDDTDFIDPKWGKRLSVAAFFLTGIAMAGWWQDFLTVKEAAAVVGILNLIVSTINYMLHANAPPPVAKVAKALVVLLAFTLLTLFLVPSAQAATLHARHLVVSHKVRMAYAALPVRRPVRPAATTTTTDPLQQFMDQLSKLDQDTVNGIITDIEAADKDAGTIIVPATATTPAVVKDPISHACYPAEVQFLQSLPVIQKASGKFVVVQLFQMKRDFVAQIQAGLPTYLKLGCSALLGDEASILTKSLGLVGITVAANTLLPGIGAAIPTLP